MPDDPIIGQPTEPTAADARAVTASTAALTEQVKLFNNRFVGLRNVSIVLSVVSVLLAGAFGWIGSLYLQQGRIVACQAEQNATYLAGIAQVRSASVRQDDQLLEKVNLEQVMLSAVTSVDLSPEQKGAAVVSYQRASKDYLDAILVKRATQRNNPIPTRICQ